MRNFSGSLAEAIWKKWEDDATRWPDARPVRIAVSVILKSDGTKKVRFILDAPRNGMTQVQDRIVLPRAHDVVTDILDPLEPRETPVESIGKMDFGAELLVVDSSDAFLSLQRREDTLRSRTVKADGSHTEASRVALCRGPLVWGPVAAYLTRLAQAEYHSAQEARALGWHPSTAGLCGCSYVFFGVFMVRSDLAWKKARFGNIVSWIGAEFALQKNGVLVSALRQQDPSSIGGGSQGEGNGGRVGKVGRRVELGRWIDTAHSPVLLPFTGSHP